jgi:hypothetical protein
MREWRPCMPPTFRDEFDAFCDVYDEKGSRNFEPTSMLLRRDVETVEDWKTRILDIGRTKGVSDPGVCPEELTHHGVAAELLLQTPGDFLSRDTWSVSVRKQREGVEV